MTDQEFQELERLERNLWEEIRPLEAAYQTTLHQWSEASNRLNREKFRRELLSEIQTIQNIGTK